MLDHRRVTKIDQQPAFTSGSLKIVHNLSQMFGNMFSNDSDLNDYLFIAYEVRFVEL